MSGSGKGDPGQSPSKKRWGSGYGPPFQDRSFFNKKLNFFNKFAFLAKKSALRGNFSSGKRKNGKKRGRIPAGFFEFALKWHPPPREKLVFGPKN
jgi:hypothetical protein